MNSKITNEWYEHIKKYLNNFSYIDLITWRNELMVAKQMDNRLLSIFNEEILNRIYKIKFQNEKKDVTHK